MAKYLGLKAGRIAHPTDPREPQVYIVEGEELSLDPEFADPYVESGRLELVEADPDEEEEESEVEDEDKSENLDKKGAEDKRRRFGRRGRKSGGDGSPLD